MTGARIFTGPGAGAARARRGRERGAGARPRRSARRCRRATRSAPGSAADRPAQLSRRDGVSGDAPPRRRVRELRPARRHLESGKAGASRRRGRHELLALAHGGVQQRRLEGRVHRRVGRRHGAELPGDEHDGDGRQHHPHDRATSKKYTQHAYFKIPTAQTRAGELRVAQRRAHSGAGPRHHGAGLVSGRHRRERLHRSRSSVSRSRSSTAVRSMRRRRRRHGEPPRRPPA